jgi:hypothetical protein
MMLAFADWSSTDTHYRVGSILSDVALPELHSIFEIHIHELLAMGVTAICFMTDI